MEPGAPVCYRDSLMNNLSLVGRAIAGILEGDLRPLLALTAPEAVLTLATAATGPAAVRSRGREAVAGYFRSLGATPTYWRVRLEDRGREIVALGTERFTVIGGIEGESDFVLAFELRDGLVTGLQVVEGSHADPPATQSLPARAILGCRPPAAVRATACAAMPDGEPHSIH